MSDPDLVVEELKHALAEIESKLVWDDLPVASLEEFKVTLDNVRTSLLALLGAPDISDYHRSLRGLRLRRATQVCRSVFSSVLDGTISAATPGFAELKSTVDQSLQQVQRLVGRST